MQQERSLFWTAVAPSLLLLVVVGMAVAGSVTIPNTFVAGQVADANQVNANFNAVRAEVNDNDLRISAIENGTTPAPLDADLLEGLAANQLVRASIASLGSMTNWDPAGYEPLLSTTVDVPVAGILLIWGRVHAYWDTGGAAGEAELHLRILVGGTEVDGSRGEVQLSSTDPGNGDETLGVFAAEAIPTPGTTSVVLSGDLGNETPNSRLDLSRRTLMTLFIPFGDSGTQGVLAKPFMLAGEDDSDLAEEE